MMITIKQRVVDRLLGIRGIKEYHIFADGIDDYNHDYKAAVRAYNKLCKEYDNVRLYVQWVDMETSEIIEENCLKAKGEFPQ